MVYPTTRPTAPLCWQNAITPNLVRSCSNSALSVQPRPQVDTEKWDTVYQVISSNGETVEIFLDEPDAIAELEAVAQAGTGKRRPRVRVDLAGAEFFSMEEVASEFEPEGAGKVAASSRTQLGYRTTEQVRDERGPRGRAKHTRGERRRGTWSLAALEIVLF